MESRLLVHNFLYNINLIFPIKQSVFQGLNFCLAQTDIFLSCETKQTPQITQI